MNNKKGFTLIELMVVILTVGILAAVAVPIMRGRIDSSKWSEANATAGTIGTAVRAYIAEKKPDYDYGNLESRLNVPFIYEALGFKRFDLDGAYFNQRDYEIKSITADPPTCVIEVRSTHPQGPPSTENLDATGNWSVN